VAGPVDTPQPEFRGPRRRLIETLQANGIHDLAVLRAFDLTPRHLFVPTGVVHRAYEDAPLPIGSGQTISQPSVHARYLQELKLTGKERVLEIGTGSGYQAAILAELAREVYTMEIIEPLAESARMTLEALGYQNVHVRAGNGYAGWPEHAPYDRIIVTAAPPEVPRALVEQLKVQGLIAIPVGTVVQELKILRRTATGMETIKTLPVQFVPMTGKRGR
jgi:protein-L-isoaspartate(D-aspartate) O-methyltransferase